MSDVSSMMNSFVQMAMKQDVGKAGLEESDNSKIRITLTAKSVSPLEKSMSSSGYSVLVARFVCYERARCCHFHCSGGMRSFQMLYWHSCRQFEELLRVQCVLT